jgi:hypothetical protein
MRAPIFGLSTTPVADIKSELRQQIERDMLALIYGATALRRYVSVRLSSQGSETSEGSSHARFEPRGEHPSLCSR